MSSIHLNKRVKWETITAEELQTTKTKKIRDVRKMRRPPATGASYKKGRS